MENFKFILFSIIVLAIVVLGGFWAFRTLEPGDIHAVREEKKALEEENEELKKEVEELRSKLADVGPASPQEEEVVDTEPAPLEPPKSSHYKYSNLIIQIENLEDENIVMKVGSKGTRVGTIQTFLNAYNDTSKRIDNDFGPGLKTDLMNFQKAVGLPADGQTGPATYKKMIEWLKKQG